MLMNKMLEENLLVRKPNKKQEEELSNKFEEDTNNYIWQKSQDLRKAVMNYIVLSATSIKIYSS